jgi:5'-phosphate synthase pdxT subunit
MTPPTIGVLALQGDVAEHAAAFERCGVPVTTVRSPEELATVDALALPGGESTTMSRLLRVFHLEEYLRKRLDAGMPCFATCAGMILLSRHISDGRPGQLAYVALDIAVRRNGYGRQVESFEADLAIPVLGAGPYPAMFIRAPLIEEVGPAAEVVAEFEGTPVAVSQGPHLAFAFHPEMTGDLRLHRHFLERAAVG